LISALFIAATANCQMVANLETADTDLHFEADSRAPRLVSLQQRSETWTSRSSEAPPETAEIDGKTVPLVWNFSREQSRAEDESVVFVYEVASPHLRLSWEWKARSSYGPIEHQIRIENLDSRDVWLPIVNSLVFDWQVSAQESLEHFYVEKGADTPSSVGTHRVPLVPGYEWEGTSSTYAQPRPGEPREIIPYFLVEHTNGEQSGWYVGIEFSGRVRLTLARTSSSLRGEAGLNPNPGPFHARVNHGDTFESPKIFLGATNGGPDAAANILRRWVRTVLAKQRTWDNPHFPLTVNNSWGRGMAVNESVALRMIRDSAELGIEMFHLDAGWFRGVGDWYPDPKKFPHGFQSLVNEAHARGLKFGLWTDWSQAALDAGAGALNIRDPKVRQWLTTDLPSTWKPQEFKGVTIDLGVVQAKAWAMRETDRIVTDYKLDMLEHDGYLVAKGCTSADHPHAPPDPLNQCIYEDAGFPFVESSNSTDVSYHATRAYYEIQDNLREKHPNILLEICNDGGRMVDFGSASHGDYFSITDTYDPLSNRRAFYDASFVLPSAMLESYVERWLTPNIENFRYMLRSGMMGWLTIMIDTTSWNPEQHADAMEELRVYKSELRPLIREADIYHISERPDGVRWDGMEYFDSKEGRGVVFAFRCSIGSEMVHSFLLKGLQAGSRYKLRFQDHTSGDQVMKGSALMNAGVQVHLPTPNTSELIFVQELRDSIPGPN
jgi:alpha-galactosidase